MSAEKTIHCVTAGLLLVAALWITCIYVELRSSVAAIFSTVSGFATFYGVVFAIIELIRTRKAAQLAREEASKALQEVSKLYGIKGLAECQAAIDVAIASVDAEDYVALGVLSHVMKLYGAVFHEEIKSDSSSQRKNQSTLESYASRPRSKARPASTANLRSAFALMTNELTAAITDKIKVHA